MTLLPTLNRIKLLENFLRSAIECNTTSPGLIIVDKNDWAKNEVAYKALQLPNGWEFFLSESVKMGDKIREAYPEAIKRGAKWINILNDDHEIKTQNWDQILEKKLDGTNFVTCQDKWMSPYKAAGATMFSLGLIEAVGFPIYPPGMKHLFIDDLWETIGRGTGVWDIDHSVTIEHHNQLKTPDKRDSTFTEVYGRDSDLTKNELWKNDEKVFHDFLRNDYINVRNKIRKLRGQQEIIYNS